MKSIAVKKEVTAQNTFSLTEGSVFKVLLRFSIPFLMANLLQALYGAVDLMVVGKFCSPKSVAAVSTGTQVTQIITSLITGFTLAGTVLVGKYVGKKELERAAKAIGTTVTFFGIFSVFLTIAMLFFLPGILDLLQIPAASYEEAYQYIFICCLGIFFLCEYNALSAVLRGCGDSFSPLVFVGVACVCNVIGDFITVGLLGLGAKGTAIATAASQGISMIAAVFYLKKKKFFFDFRLRNLRMDKALLKEILRVGIPVSFQECMVRFSFLYLTAITNSFGVYTASAVGIASKYDVFAMLPATSVSNALTALTAQNLGAGKKKRAVQFLKYGMGLAFICSLAFFVWAQVSPQTMTGLFSKDTRVLEAAIPFFRGCSFDYLAVSFLFCLNGYLTGHEKTVVTMLNCCSGAILVRVPLLTLLHAFSVENLQLYGLVSPFSSLIMLGVIALYFSFNTKKQRKTLRKAVTA